MPSAVYSQIAAKQERPWRTVTSAYNALQEDRLFLDSSAGVFTITLPSNPIVGDQILFMDLSGTLATYNVTLAANGSNIMGTSDDLLLDVANTSFCLVYANATAGWRVL
jgi:hypothetical protein